MKQKIFVDMDGTLCEFRKGEPFEALFQKGYFESLKPFDNMVAFVKQLDQMILEGVIDADLYILTSVLKEARFARREKINWLTTHLNGVFTLPKIVFVPYGKDKYRYASRYVDSGNIVLIDDYNVNLKNWKNIAIKAVNDVNDTNKSWDGARINVFDNPDTILQQVLAVLPKTF